MSIPVSAALYARLIEEATNKRLRESLERIKEACDFLESARAAMTPTSVGKYCIDRWGGPRSQSIRNADKTLFAYVKARSSEQVLPVASHNAHSFEPAIQDETIRAYVALIKAERDEAVRAKNRIVAGLRSIPGVPIDEWIRDRHMSDVGRLTRDEVKPASLPPQARVAIETLLDRHSLQAVGLELYRQRLRSVATNQVLLDKSQVEALIGLLGTDATGIHEHHRAPDQGELER
ncbi:hypothetical protein ACYT84_10710 [Ralstonia solanacearum]|uniref:hypothetical protein n=1 Tax=Ralstonia solanacearum TaxID=305 RepID=UPI0018D1BA1A|nr:hypothetical protein [Ralstonia solanacearum]